MWGKIKNTGDDWMYPKPLMDLRFFSVPLLYCFTVVIFDCILSYLRLADFDLLAFNYFIFVIYAHFPL